MVVVVAVVVLLVVVVVILPHNSTSSSSLNRREGTSRIKEQVVVGHTRAYIHGRFMYVGIYEVSRFRSV